MFMPDDGISLLALTTLFFTSVIAYDGGMSYLSYAFPGVNGDLTKVTWAHAVNSKAKLHEALEGDKMILEADVSLGRLTGKESGILRPIMAHPPNITSDLSLEEFLDASLKSDKGIKLDFKSREAFSLSEYIIAEALINSDSIYPLIMNADIIEGPINCTKIPVDADYFLTTVVTKFPSAIISVGWTTCYGPGNSVGSYTPRDTERMTSALIHNHVVGEVTFPVRAGLAAQSLKTLSILIGSSADATLTIWSTDAEDPVDVPALKKLIETVGRDKVFLDVNDKLRDDIMSSSPRSTSSLTQAALLLIAFAALIL